MAQDNSGAIIAKPIVESKTVYHAIQGCIYGRSALAPDVDTQMQAARFFAAAPRIKYLAAAVNGAVLIITANAVSALMLL